MKRLWAVTVLLLLCTTAAFSGTDSHDVSLTISTIAALRVYQSAGAISLTIAAPGTAGSLPPDVTNATSYLQYTVASFTVYRILVSASGTVPAGTVLTVVASNPGAGGGGVNKGASAGSVALTDGMSATPVLTSIQSCYTGNVSGEGSNLTYTYGVGGTFGDEVPGGGSLTVTYTLVTP